MYEKLTAFIPRLEKSDYGRWAPPRGDGSSEHPFRKPYVIYDWFVRKLAETVLDLAVDKRGNHIGDFTRILEQNNIAWTMTSMKQADVSSLAGRTVYALLLGAVRAEENRTGALLEFCTSGCVLRWLYRLKEIDECPVMGGIIPEQGNEKDRA